MPGPFGPLEIQVMDALGRLRRPGTVRDLEASFPALAYTTLMTTLDRLHKKGVLRRAKVGRAFAYEPVHDRPELEMRLAARGVEELLGAARGRGAVAPLLSCFIDAVTERDRALLDDLEKALEEKRARDERGETS
jgi:predicted transcriptional regulator